VLSERGRDGPTRCPWRGSYGRAGNNVSASDVAQRFEENRWRLTRQLYQRASVGDYWIVDVDSRLVERWRRVRDILL
jgi:hypothetical protein